MSGREYDAIVIGAGLNGLTTAGYLARSGLRTLVLERRSLPGGLAATEEIAPGFRCDTGLHDTGWLPPRVARELGLSGYRLELLRPDPVLCAPLPGGGALVFHRDVGRTAESLRAHRAADAARWPGFVSRMQRHARVLAALYASPPPRLPAPRLGDLATLLRFGRRLRGLGREGMTDFLRILPMPVAELLDECFEHETLKGALGAAGCFGVCQGPRSGGTAFVLLHHLVGAEPGVFRARGLVRGGSGRLAEILADAAAVKGAEIRYEAEVRQVLVRDGRAIGVVLADGREVGGRVVASSADPRRTFLSLVGASELEPEFVRDVTNIRCRGAWAKVNLAVGELPRFRGVDPSALGGIVSLTPSLDDLERAYDDAKYGRPSQRPSLEVRIPSLADGTLAPPGRHVLSIRVQYAPYRSRSGGWDAGKREALGDRVIATLAEYAPDLPDAILHRQVLTPADLEDRFALTAGDPAHGELALDQILFMRPLAGWARYRTPIENLFLCGSGAHPGPGIVGGPARLAARAIATSLRRTRARV